MRIIYGREMTLIIDAFRTGKVSDVQVRSQAAYNELAKNRKAEAKDKDVWFRPATWGLHDRLTMLLVVISLIIKVSAYVSQNRIGAPWLTLILRLLHWQLTPSKIVCLTVAAEVISIMVTLGGKLVGVTPRWKRILEVLALAPYVPETIVKGWSLSGGEKGLKIASCTLKCVNSCLPLLGTLTFRYITWEKDWALEGQAKREPDLSC
jgi:hypothetical protein